MTAETPSNKSNAKVDQDQWVFILKDGILKKHDSTEPGFSTLRHPKSEELCMFLFPADNSCVYEILKFEEDHRSWFIGETVQKDGSLFIPTVVDPVFLALPYIIKEAKSGKFIPVDQLVVDDEAAGINRLCTCLEKTKLDCVADVKGDDDFRAVRYNADKTLNWLKKKVEVLADTLSQKGVDISSGAHATIFQQHSAGTESSKEDHIRYAHGVVSDYISVSLSQDLKTFMDIKDPVREKPNREKPEIEASASKRAKKGSLAPTEDYSQSNVLSKDKSTAKQSVAQKKLSKVDTKGMKSMANFFMKKPKS